MSYVIPLGIYANEHIISPNSSIEYLYDSQTTMLNMTIRLDNANSYPQNGNVKLVFIEYGRGFTTNYTLTNIRYGVYVDEIRMNKMIITNNSDLANAEIYIETITKPLSNYPNEIIQFITQINSTSPPNNQTLYQGSNNRYTGTLANATFLKSVPLNTPMAIRQINAQSTTSSIVGFVTIEFAQNFTFNANIEPLGIINFTSTFAFKTDTITNTLPTSAIQTDTLVNYVMIDYYLDYNLQVNFTNYTITTSGSTTDINFNGNVFVYYYTNTSLPFSNASISSITTSNTSYTISPTSGTTNSSGNVPFAITQQLTPTSDLSGSVSTSTTIGGISKNASSTIPPLFDFDSLLSVTQTNSSQTYSSAGTYTLSLSNTVYATIQGVAGGGGGGGRAGGGGGGGGYGTVTSNNNTTLTITIGVGGAGGAVASGNIGYPGNSGGNTTVVGSTTILSLTGGGGGGANSGAGGTSGGTDATAGQPSSSNNGGNGGSSYYGTGGAGGVNEPGSNATNYGSGGGGGGLDVNTGLYWAGGNGMNGYISISWTTTAYTLTIQTNQSTPEPIPNQPVTLTITGTGTASFSATSSVLTTTATTDSNGQITSTTTPIYNCNNTNTLTTSCKVASITKTSSSTI